MNPLQRTLIEKAGHDSGFEHVREGGDHEVRLASARHPCTVQIQAAQDLGKGFVGHIQQGMPTLMGELGRMFVQADGAFALASEAMLAQWLRRAASLSQALPNQAVLAYETQVAAELEALAEPTIGQTEVKRMVRQRVGQQAYRQAMLNYWGDACAVTGLTLPQALRASHARPWAECETDAQRLDVFNGFLLSANLDALFDGFLISFSDDGQLLVSEHLTSVQRSALGLTGYMCLRWVAPTHLPYMRFHRGRFLNGVSTQAVMPTP